MAVEHFGPIAELETNEAVIDTVPHAALVPPYATTGTDVGAEVAAPHILYARSLISYLFLVMWVAQTSLPKV
ncbi:MAG: hypothetical protein ACK45C_09975 [Bacteroidota bacterium]